MKTYIQAYCYVCVHDGHLADCPESELAAFGKLTLLAALCRYWNCLPTTEMEK